MTENQIQNEIRAQVVFKFKEFTTSLKNRVAFKYAKAFNMTNESSREYLWFKEIEGMIKKEVEMPIPAEDFLTTQEKRKRRDKAVNEIIEIFPEGYNRIPIKTIVNIIEKAQEY